jgi:adenylate cyclase
MTRSTLQRLRLLVAIIAASAVMGACYGFSPEPGEAVVWPLLTGGTIGASISSVIFGMELFAARHWAGLRRLPVSIAFLARTAAYAAVVVATMLVLPWLFFDAAFSVTRDGFAGSVVSSLWMTFVLSGVMTIVQLIGPGVLGKLLIGHYHRPREEQRIVMFLDLAGSTRIAEQIGNVRFHALLADVFGRLSTIVTDWGGEVHRYVGDQLIATWRVGNPADNARPVACVFACADALTKAELTMKRRHGVSPRFRVSVHLGTLVAGEIGGFKREISYIGEAMNTAARLEQACRETGRMLVASKAFLDGCELPGHARATSLGLRTLRGIAEPVELFAIERSRASGVKQEPVRLTDRADYGQVAAVRSTCPRVPRPQPMLASTSLSEVA